MFDREAWATPGFGTAPTGINILLAKKGKFTGIQLENTIINFTT